MHEGSPAIPEEGPTSPLEDQPASTDPNDRPMSVPRIVPQTEARIPQRADKPFTVSSGVLKEIAQSLLEAHKMGRSLENLVTAFIPLTDDEVVANALKEISAAGGTASKLSKMLYELIAREAAK